MFPKSSTHRRKTPHNWAEGAQVDTPVLIRAPPPDPRIVGQGTLIFECIFHSLSSHSVEEGHLLCMSHSLTLITWRKLHFPSCQMEEINYSHGQSTLLQRAFPDPRRAELNHTEGRLRDFLLPWVPLFIPTHQTLIRHWWIYFVRYLPLCPFCIKHTS